MLLCVCSVIYHRRRQNVVRTSVTHSAIASCATFWFLPHFDVICDLLLNRRTATWNLFVNYIINGMLQLRYYFCVTSLDFFGFFCLRLKWVLCFSFSHALFLVVGTWNCVQVVFWFRSFQAICVVELICE